MFVNSPSVGAPHDVVFARRAVPHTMLSSLAPSCPTRCCLRRRHRAPDDVVFASHIVPHTMLSSVAQRAPDDVVFARRGGAPHDVVFAAAVPHTMLSSRAASACPRRCSARSGVLGAPHTTPGFQAGRVRLDDAAARSGGCPRCSSGSTRQTRITADRPGPSGRTREVDGALGIQEARLPASARRIRDTPARCTRGSP